jgi:flagellar protein FliO/FliZ
MDTVDPARFVASFIFILALIALMAYLLKRFGGTALLARAVDENSRIRMIETRYLDPKRKLVIVRKDEKEYFLLLSEGREMLIESGEQGAMMQDGQPQAKWHKWQAKL